VSSTTTQRIQLNINSTHVEQQECLKCKKAPLLPVFWTMETQCSLFTVLPPPCGNGASRATRTRCGSLFGSELAGRRVRALATACGYFGRDLFLARKRAAAQTKKISLPPIQVETPPPQKKDDLDHAQGPSLCVSFDSYY
jgi:hypothetical protein